MLTLVGFFFIVLCFMVQFWFCDNLQGSAPSWVYFANAACLFLYQTLDAIDGKQVCCCKMKKKKIDGSSNYFYDAVLAFKAHIY